jgi:hypothetical protein
VEPASWVVATLFGLATGWYFGRQHQELRAVRVILALSLAIGVVGWIISPSDMAGPSLIAGGGTGLAGTLVAARKIVS